MLERSSETGGQGALWVVQTCGCPEGVQLSEWRPRARGIELEEWRRVTGVRKYEVETLGSLEGTQNSLGNNTKLTPPW